MRGTATGLDTPYPLGTLLPAVLQEDPLAMRLMSALDVVLAPVIATLDCLPAYVDPAIAPRDFLEWLGTWVGATLDENWPIERQRAAVACTVELYRARGTVHGLRRFLEVATGGQVEVVDNGGVNWSTSPNSELPGEESPRLAVRVRNADITSLTETALDELVAAAKPAHVVHRVELVN